MLSKNLTKLKNSILIFYEFDWFIESKEIEEIGRTRIFLTRNFYYY